MKHTKARALTLGYQARIDGFGLSANPYVNYPDPRKRAALMASWREGWSFADSEINKEVKSNG